MSISLPSWNSLISMLNCPFKINPHPKNPLIIETNSITIITKCKNDSRSRLYHLIKNSKILSAPWKNSSPLSVSNSSLKALTKNPSKPKINPQCLKTQNESSNTKISEEVSTCKKSKTIFVETTWKENLTLRLNTCSESWKKIKPKKINTGHGWRTFLGKSAWNKSHFWKLQTQMKPSFRTSNSVANKLFLLKSQTILMSRK